MAQESSVWHYITDHPKVAGVLAFLAFAATFSPKASTVAAWSCTVAAWVPAVMVVAGLPPVKSRKRPAIPIIIAAIFLGFGSFRYASWLTAANEEKKPAANEAGKSSAVVPAPIPVPAPGPKDGGPINEGERTESSIPKMPSMARTPRQLKLLFKDSALLTNERRERIAVEMERYYKYLVKLGFDAPREVPPIGVNKRVNSSEFWSPGSIYDQSVFIGDNRLGDPQAIRSAYGGYAFRVLLGVGHPEQNDELQRMEASLIFWVYFEYSFSGTNGPFVGDGIYRWLRALWKIRQTCGSQFVDAAMVYTQKLVNEPRPSMEFDPWFVMRFGRGARVAENQGEKMRIVNAALKAENLVH